MRRALVALALTASLATSTPSSLFDPLWSFLSSIWGGTPVSNAGCEWDPNGRCGGAPQPQTEAGCEWDPYGRCKPGS
jgi:hypothetical protein